MAQGIQSYFVFENMHINWFIDNSGDTIVDGILKKHLTDVCKIALSSVLSRLPIYNRQWILSYDKRQKL